MQTGGEPPIAIEEEIILDDDQDARMSTVDGVVGVAQVDVTQEELIIGGVARAEHFWYVGEAANVAVHPLVANLEPPSLLWNGQVCEPTEVFAT